MNNDGDDNSSVGNNSRANTMNKKRSSYTKKQIVMSDSKLSEEAALTAQLFGGDVGGGAPSSAAWMDEDDNEEDDALNTNDAMVSNNVSGGGESDLLFAIDRSGEEVTTDDNNNVQSDDENESEEVRHPPLDYDDDNRSNEDDDDSDDDDDDDVKDVNNKASMTGAAWQDSDTDNNSSSDSEVDDDDDGSSDEDEQQQHLPPNKKQKKGVSLVDGPDRLKKLRRYRDETNPLSLKEYELRLRERFMNTSSVAARTDWASVGLAQKQQQLGDDEEDDEDGGIQRKKKKMRGYASSSSEEEDGSDDDEDYKDKATQLLQSNASLFETSNKSNGIALPPTLLNVVRARDGNLSDPNNSVVNATQFHPQSDEDSPLLMTAGMDKMLRFFRINDDTNNGENTKIHGIHFPKMPITCASFLTGGGGSSSSNVVLSGRRPFFYVYDAISGSIQKIPSIIGRSERSLEKFVVSPPSSSNRSMIAFIGNDGYIILVDGVTHQWIGDLKMNGSVRAITFSEDGEYIMGSGSDGDVYKWHIGSRRCVERFHNEDGTITSSLAISSKFLAVGAESGVVNLYNDRQSYSSMPSRSSSTGSSIAPTATMTERTPLKSIMNLTTSADNVCFNHDGQILAMSTRRETNGLKLLHVPTATVFSNWPTSKTPLKYVWSMDFSPGSKYFTVGNDHGKCLLYRLKHYWDE